MGHRLELVTPAPLAPAYITAARRLNIDADVIGEVRQKIDPSVRVLIETGQGSFEYN
jgi:hypothetical protein